MAAIRQVANGANPSISFAAPTVSGKLLLAWETKRDGVCDLGSHPGSPVVWTALSSDVAATGDHGRWWYANSNGATTFVVPNSSRLTLYELEIDGAGWTPADATLYETNEHVASTSLDLGAVVGEAVGQTILYGCTYDTAFGGSLAATPGSGWVIDYNVNKDGDLTGVSDRHPHILTMTWNGSTIPLTGTATIASAYAYCGVMVQLDTAVLADCDSPVAFDVYSLGTATSPALTYLATLCDAFDKSFRVELDGTGSGRFSINRTSLDATAAILGDGDGDVRYVQVRIPDIDADAIFGFFIEEGDFRLLDSDEQGGQTLTFSGHGSLAYLGFATMLAHSYITGGMDPYTGLWRLYLAGTGSKPGQMLGRIIEEAQDADRPQVPLPLLTDTFDYTNDSNAAAWASSSATNEFAAQIGESVLSVVGRLIGTGALTVQMSPTFVLSAYNTFGTDRTSATFAANKIRFVGGTNIAEGLTRQIRPSRVATHELVYGESETSVIASLADAATRVTREAGLSSFGTDTTALTAVGAADLAERLLRSESLSVRIALGSDDATGLYLPGPAGSTAGKFWVGDTVTLHTGTGEFDYNNASFPVAAINVIEPLTAKLVTDLEVQVELGSTKIGDAPGGGSSNLLSASPGGGSSAVPPHTHPGLSGNAELNRHGGQSVLNPLGTTGATKNIDPALGNVPWGTLGANTAFTILAPVADGNASLVLWLYTGAGGFTPTFAATGGTFVWDGATPTLPTAAGVWYRVVLERIVNTTNDWVGDLVGGGALTVEDEGTPLATAATTLDFVGAGVTATGAGAEKTITIPGDAAHIADTTDAHDASAISFSPTGTIAATDVQAAIAEVASEAGTSGDKFVVDPGSPSYAGSGPTVTLTSVFGITSGGAPYYNAANVTSGEEAALMRDPTSGTYFLRDYNF